MPNVHVIPENDLRPHAEHRNCWCGPTVTAEGVVIHNSADGREFREPGAIGEVVLDEWEREWMNAPLGPAH